MKIEIKKIRTIQNQSRSFRTYTIRCNIDQKQIPTYTAVIVYEEIVTLLGLENGNLCKLIGT